MREQPGNQLLPVALEDFPVRGGRPVGLLPGCVRVELSEPFLQRQADRFRDGRLRCNGVAQGAGRVLHGHDDVGTGVAQRAVEIEDDESYHAQGYHAWMEINTIGGTLSRARRSGRCCHRPPRFSLRSGRLPRIRGSRRRGLPRPPPCSPVPGDRRRVR